MLDMRFNKKDLETLIEAVGDWELVGSQEFAVLQQIKDMPLPPEEHEAYEAYKRIKDYYLQREKVILFSREQRAEEAVFLKAKLMYTRKKMQETQMAELFTAESEPPVPELPISDQEDKLKLAEFFIRDLGVWQHYENFLSSQQKS